MSLLSLSRKDFSCVRSVILIEEKEILGSNRRLINKTKLQQQQQQATFLFSLHARAYWSVQAKFIDRIQLASKIPSIVSREDSTDYSLLDHCQTERNEERVLLSIFVFWFLFCELSFPPKTRTTSQKHALFIIAITKFERQSMLLSSHFLISFPLYLHIHFTACSRNQSM